MTIEVVSFIIGGILIGTAIVGGGFEIKEIKMPRVGAGVRIVSLLVGSGFLLLAMGMWGLNNPQLLANSGPTTALRADAQTPSAASEESARTQTREVAQPEQQAVQQPVVDPEPQPAPGFTGFNGDTYLSWQIEGTAVSAAARFAGMGGVIRIGWVDPSTGEQDEVLQDLILQQDANGVLFYQGVNPRDAATEKLRYGYNADRFRVVSSDQGWTIDQVCDVQACWQVFVR